MTLYYFVQPTDSLFVRGNLAFGNSGEHGAGVMPPPPSLFAGAFRSAILGRDGQALAAFTAKGKTGRAEVDSALGEFDPGTGAILRQGRFRIAWLSLAGTLTPTPSPEGEAVEAILQLPADLVRLESGFARLTPGEPHALLRDGRQLPRVAVLRSAKQEKPQGGFYLRQSGSVRHLQGDLPDSAVDAIEARHIHARDPRLGIGLNGDARSAESGLIYTTEGHAFSPSSRRGEEGRFAATGFLVGIDGADGLLPEFGFLRLGGDGRGAQYRRVDFQPPRVPLDAIENTGRFRLILKTPGLFAPGWLPAGITRQGDDWKLQGEGYSARLVCAAVPRREVVSGWDLFQWKPKPAQRAVPSGSVYWFEDFQGDVRKLAEWVKASLWGDNPDHARCTEGFNRALLGHWREES